MLLPGAEALGLNHRQCLELLESAEDTLDFLISTLVYLIYAESRQPQPDSALIDSWRAQQQEIVEFEYSLPGSSAADYQQAIHTCSMRIRELRPLVERYRSKEA